MSSRTKTKRPPVVVTQGELRRRARATAKPEHELGAARERIRDLELERDYAQAKRAEVALERDQAKVRHDEVTAAAKAAEEKFRAELAAAVQRADLATRASVSADQLRVFEETRHATTRERVRLLEQLLESASAVARSIEDYVQHELENPEVDWRRLGLLAVGALAPLLFFSKRRRKKAEKAVAKSALEDVLAGKTP